MRIRLDEMPVTCTEDYLLMALVLAGWGILGVCTWRMIGSLLADD